MNSQFWHGVYDKVRQDYVQAAARPGSTLDRFESPDCQRAIMRQPVTQEHVITVCSALGLPPPAPLRYVFDPHDKADSDDEDDDNNDAGDADNGAGEGGGETIGLHAASASAPASNSPSGRGTAPLGTSTEAAPIADGCSPPGPKEPSAPPAPPVEVSAAEVYNGACTHTAIGMNMVCPMRLSM